VFYINNVKTVMISDQGKEALGILGEGEFFGEYCLIAEQLRLTTAIALADSTALTRQRWSASSMINQYSPSSF
jgi:CRP/FNR family transcriptional regulator, cyclic AMP receptor protein